MTCRWHPIDAGHALIIAGIVAIPVVYFGVLFLAIIIAGSAR